MLKQGKLELTWVGKYEEKKIEPRILIEDKSKSYGDPNTENMLIHGDNLIALKALEQDYAGKIKCIYIDPPYNTGSAFEHYDDGLEHSVWLNMIYDRLKLLYSLLSNDGLLWISIDDNECHYLKIICDEIFGRTNFIADITYERSGSAGLGQGGVFVNNSEHILVYKKEELVVNEVLGSVELEFKTMKRYNKILVKEGNRQLIEEFESKSNGETVKIYKHENFVIETISLRSFEQRESEIRNEFLLNFDKLFRTNNVQKENEFQNDLLSRMDKKYLYTVDYIPSRGKNKGRLTTLYYYNAELFAWLKDTAYIEQDKIMKTNKLTTVWVHSDIPKADLANEGGVEFPRSKKPEQLIKRIIEISTNEGDYVLDSFLGSGTTAAVAHKLNRRYIGIELGNHAYTHCIQRLKNVIDGNDNGGITKSVNWQGGGGFKFYELAEPLLIKNSKLPIYSINPSYTFDMMAEAICKIEGFKYKPIGNFHGKSSENRFIHVTNEFVNSKYVFSLVNELEERQSLLIYCTKMQSDINLPDNVEIKKIPKDLLNKCSFESEGM
ncbi:site-specific DNA-methyltransferase [Clostridium manihotivorum]|uniref:Site-specific DNA-methyltransferase n=1 Tax=Clostridium manihotivorum TaxID=2320868 RepID=A0A410E0P9_9CLOT|nr:site-specific DNA-methyltransferase [Clostridium manihotivorum]QAA34904.1 site-specific DNA-methyltransferase [Clostridium manihotivorum]